MGATTAQYSLSFDSAKAGLPKSVDQWAKDIHAHSRLPDARLQRRLVNITKTLACFPTDSLPHACADWAETKAAYRFIENDRLAPEDLHDGLPKSTALRCAGLKAVFSVQDTTDIVFPAACHAEGLGRINSSPSRGALLHSAVGMSSDGLPLGILHMHSWCRKDDGKTARDRANRPIEEKESVRWLNAMRGAHQAIAELPPELRPVLWHVGDREMDIHEVFALAESLGDPVVVRWARDRRIENENQEIGKAHQSVAKSPCRGVVEIQVPRKRTEPARTAIAEIRFERQTLKPGKGNPRQRGRAPITLWLIEVRETAAPQGATPLHWLLWTNQPVDSLEDAVQSIEIYRKRWRIEDYHLVLKEGCRLEEVRFHTADRIRLAIALYAPVAHCRNARCGPPVSRRALHDPPRRDGMARLVDHAKQRLARRRPSAAHAPTGGEMDRTAGRPLGTQGRRHARRQDPLERLSRSSTPDGLREETRVAAQPGPSLKLTQNPSCSSAPRGGQRIHASSNGSRAPPCGPRKKPIELSEPKPSYSPPGPCPAVCP
jgi:hypothetical protein